MAAVDAGRRPLRASIQVEALTPTIGAYVDGLDLTQDLSEAELACVNELFLEHKVLFFRNQPATMTSEDQLRFVAAMSRHWNLLEPGRGRVTPQARLTTRGGVLVNALFPGPEDLHPGLVTIGSRPRVKTAQEEQGRALPSSTQTKRSSPTAMIGSEDRGAMTKSASTLMPTARIWTDTRHFPTGTLLKKRLPRAQVHGERGRGSWRRFGQEELYSGNIWHCDNQWMENPPWATTLRVVSLPRNGGDMCFANMEALYDDLDDATQCYLETLTQFTDWEVLTPGVRLKAERTRNYAELMEMKRKFPTAEHPVIRTHPQTGKKSVYVNPLYCQGIKGMPDEEAGPLLRELYALTSTPEYCCRLKWEPGVMAMWDNRCVQHYAASDYQEEQKDSVRILEHIGTVGDKPF